MQTWIIYSLISMLFTGVTAVIAKHGLKDISSDLGVVVRTAAVLVFVVLNFFIFQSAKEITNLSTKAIIFLVVSGLTTAVSWIFYYKAIKIGEISYVASIDKSSILITIVLSYFFLSEPITLKLVIGSVLILAGLLVLTWKF